MGTVVSPVFTMVILLGGSGIPTSEGKNLGRFYKNPKKKDSYDALSPTYITCNTMLPTVLRPTATMHEAVFLLRVPMLSIQTGKR